MKKNILIIVIVLCLSFFILGLFNITSLDSINISIGIRYFLYYLFILLLLFILSFLFTSYFLLFIFEVGIPFFLLPSFIASFGLKGVLFLIICFLLFKLVPCFLLLLNSFYAFRLNKHVYFALLKRNKFNIKNFKIYYKKNIIILIFLISYYFITFFVGNKVYTFLVNYLLF